MGPGRLIGVGLGAGDPGWLTRAALEALAAAGDVCVPVAEGGEGWAAALAGPHLDPARQRVHVLPFPSRPGQAAAAWARHGAWLASLLAAGRDVVVAVEGDPGLYSTFGRLVRAVRPHLRDLEVRMVPGVSSVTAAAAAAGVDLAQGEEGVAILPATGDPERLRWCLRAFETVAVLKAGPALPHVRRLVEEAGRLEQAVLVERCGRPDQRVVPLAALPAGARADYFSLLLVRAAGRRTGGDGR